MNGQLNEQPLVELIREIFSQSLEGVLRLRHGAVKVVIYFERGDIVYAAANVRELRFTEYLKKQGLFSETELQSFRDKSDLALAASLSASGQIDLKTISKLLTQQVVDVLRVALLWREGSWEFDSRAHLEDSLRVKIDARNLLLQAARKMQPQVITERLPNQAEVLTQGSEITEAAALSPEEGYMLSRLANPDSLKNLIVSSGLSEADALRSIYGLALAGFAKRERWPSVLKKDRPYVAPAAPVAVEETAEPTAADVSVHTTADEVEDLLRRLDTATTHYDVLNLKPEATTEEIKNSYYSLARRYHPDLFHKQKGTPLHASVESAFAKIAQAYVTLADPKQRASYNAKLAAREKVKRASVEVPKATQPDRPQAEVLKKQNAQAVAQSDLARAESSFQEGFLALQQGQTKAALVSLAAAARLAPDQARFRAYYGRALATTETTRRLAEAELQTALKLDPENSNYRLMLAELYFELGFLRRAEGELKRVLRAEPSNPGGLKLMRRLETATT